MADSALTTSNSNNTDLSSSSSSTAVTSVQQQPTDEILTFHLQLPINAAGAHILASSLDFGKPVKETTRKFSVVSPLPEQQRDLSDLFPVLVLDVLISAPNAKLLRVAVHGFFEQLTLATKTLQMFGPSSVSHNQNPATSSSFSL